MTGDFFYPSINPFLVNPFLAHFIPPENTRKPKVLYNDVEPWVKKEIGSFDVTKAVYDGAEVWELAFICCI